jgi:N-acetylglucosamine-6-sulfatase
MSLDDNPRPGIDYWVSVKGQGNYLNPLVNDNGNRKEINGYFTDIFNEYAVKFLQRKHDKPFLLYVSHKAVHPDLQQAADGTLSDPSAGNFIPAERHKGLYANATIPHRKNVASNGEGKPALLRKLPGVPPLSRETGTSDETIRKRLRVLTAADEGLGQIFATLEKTHQLDNTLIIFTSDEGYFYGEHGLSVERRLAYEESIRIPLFMRYPGMIKPGSSIDEMALNIDICPTLCEIAGAQSPEAVDGKSLVSLLRREKTPWRKSFLVEYYSDTVFPRVSHMGYKAVRTDRWKYIHYQELEGMDELYDLKKDPFEMGNVIDKQTAALPELKAQLSNLLK